MKKIIGNLFLIQCILPLAAMERPPQEPFQFERLPNDMQRQMYSYFVRPIQESRMQAPHTAIDNIIAASARQRIADIRSFLQTRRKYYNDKALNQLFINQIATSYNQNPLEVALQLHTAGATAWLKDYLTSNIIHMNKAIGMFLHAAESANLETFMGFTKAGLTAQIADRMGNSPLLLLSQGAIPAEFESSFSPQRKRQQQIAAWLIAHGADPNAGNLVAYPLFEAARNNNTDMVLLLLKNGANPNIAGQDGSTPLLWAVSYRNLPVVQALLAKGMRTEIINKTNNMRNTALQVAQLKGYKEIEKLLKKHGAKNS